MCTALCFNTRFHYFGRTLDLDRSYGETVCVTPRSYPFAFRQMGKRKQHYALIGMAAVIENTPLYYDAANECGLAMAGLNFPGNAFYGLCTAGKENVAPFELIPWILCQCKTVEEAETLLSRLHLADISFRDDLPSAPLHWIISDRNRSIVVEAMRDGLHVIDNPVGVLTNNPPFVYQLENLRYYEHLRTDNANMFQQNDLPYVSYCQGLGAVGLPGDVSSMSRFVRMAFGRKYTACEADELSSVGQFFHLLSSVEMIEGLCKTDAGTWDKTVYSACINTECGLYYYTTYQNRQITCVDLHRTDLDSDSLYSFPLNTVQSIQYQN